MHKIRTLIVDDESLARRITKEFLKPHLDIEIIGECEHGLAAVDTIQEKDPDLIFLDIQMPKLTGFEVLAETKRQHGVIFATAYDEYALKAFNQHAIDYLLKPFSQARFNEALDKARKMLGVSQNHLQTLNQRTQQQSEKIVVKDRGHSFIIPIEKIAYIQAQDDYIQIFYEDKFIMKTQSLSDIEKQLEGKPFIRIHRSTLINFNFLEKLDKSLKDNYQAVMLNGTQLPISRSGYDKLKPFLLNL